MSSYRELTNSPAYNFLGDAKWDIKTPSYDWLNFDGSILLQNSYTKLFEQIGYILDNPSGSTFIIPQEDTGTVSSINDLTYANNTFVYAGNNGVLSTSTNGLSWVPQSSDTIENINALTYNNGTFVYAGNGGVLATSPNAVTWTIRDSATSNNIKALTYGNGNFVYGGDGVVATSPDAITWTPKIYQIPQYVGGTTFARAGTTSTTDVSLTALTGGLSSAPAEGDVVFIAVSCASTTLLSQIVGGYTQIASLYANDLFDTNLWVGYKVMGSTPDTSVTIPGSGSLDDAQTVALQVWRGLDLNDLFDVTRTTSTRIDTVLADPPSITTITNDSVLLVIGAGAHNSTTQTYGASYLDNFLTVGANGSNDSTIGFGSIARPTPGTYDPAAFTFSVADSTSFSCAAVTIALKGVPNINALTYANNTFVYAGDRGSLATSPDAITWTARTSGTTQNINTLTYGNGTFVYGGDGGVLRTSSNAVTWTARTSGTTQNINTLTYGNGTFVYGGDGGVLRTSSNAVTWTARTSGTTQNINVLNYGNGTFVYGGDGGVLATSPDAITWTPRTSGLNQTLQYVGGRTFSRAGSTSTTDVSLTALTGGLSSAPAEGDVVFIAVATGSIALRSQAVSGYIQIASLYVNDTNATNLWVGYKVMGSTPDTSVTIPGSGSLNDAQTVALQVWRGLDPGELFDVDATTATATNTVLADPPAITTRTNDSVLLVIGAGAHTDTTETYGASYLDNFLTVGANGSNDSTIGFGSIARPTPGTYFSAIFTFSGADSTNFSYAAVTIALKSARNIKDLNYQNNYYILGGSLGILRSYEPYTYDYKTEFKLPSSSTYFDLYIKS
jgi:hypothetical protein